MAASKRPSFLKRQKEQQRLQRAAQKRETRLTRKHNRGTEIDPSDLPETADEVAADSALGTPELAETETETETGTVRELAVTEQRAGNETIDPKTSSA